MTPKKAGALSPNPRMYCCDRMNAGRAKGLLGLIDREAMVKMGWMRGDITMTLTALASAPGPVG